ncbi:histone deacetylase complex subunit [Grosmannia clavigera kw1407]|uniref:Histone deacetylase complex subunit n=1 Tax=Grosmannia clavigera (strain kw1407 / UAMH 11150) TaxID=655863 RepID=F0XPT1_GROCL|nr:histone deacetylase complex subunit [Grosmannia clavigera kw1407]EFX00124.1 histone deacetylase complex subunit [Grosmannia clavigera kw1407]
MDAQNATAAASMKPIASSISDSLSSRNVSESDRAKVASSTLAKASGSSRLPTAHSKDARLSLSRPPPLPASATPSQLQSSKELPSKEAPKSPATITAASSSFRGDASSTASREKQDEEGGGTDGNSEAETIVLSKDGSPAKPRNRKVIKHEDKRNGDCGSSISAHDDQSVPTRKHNSDRKENPSVKVEKALPTTTIGDEKGASTEGGLAPSSSLLQKKKCLQEKQLQSGHHQLLPGAKRASSSLSSAPASPPHSRQPSTNPHSESDSDRRAAKSPMLLLPPSKDKLRPTEKLIPNKRKAPKAESEDEAENRKARRQRLNGASEGDSTPHTGKVMKSQLHHGGHNGNTKPPTPRPQREPSRNRSISPQRRVHHRSLSTQLPSQSNGLSSKKKRPTPLQSTDYHSDESSASAGPHIRSSKPRSLTTPATADSTMSPAKIGPHKKHLDAHGQTFLARACARGEYDLAKQRLAERPEDLNVADFAGNTPLQIAALNGYGDIVKLLIDAGCNLDCVNHDKDTPLLDAVDNGHLEVVKLLLDAGVSPRKANVHGEEPLDRVSDDIENSTEIRAALVSARKREGERRHTSEENRHEHDEPRLSHGPDSPRRSPAPSSSLHSVAISRRAGTARATKTSNHLLYMPMDDKTLRLAAGRGDEETVTRILQVREAFDDPESMVAAARGGHDIVMQLLLALGRANPDPEPIASVPAEHATPMLAAIGQENLKVVNLLLEQNSFDPTRRFHGSAYYEIARQRAGPNWKEEEDLLKAAYDNFKKGHVGKDGKLRSPVRKDVEPRRVVRLDPSEELSRAHKRKLSSPSQDRGKKVSAKSTISATSTSPQEERPLPKRSEHSGSQADGRSSPKRSGAGSVPTGKHRRDDRSSAVPGPDRDTPTLHLKHVKSKKTDQEVVAISSEGETVKPRRKLISGRELKDEKEKQRRASLASTNTAPSKESTSPRESRSEDNAADKARAEKHRDRDRDRARQLKSEESRESLSGTDGGLAKRYRMSETPSSDKDAVEGPIKKRKLDGDGASISGKERKVSKVNGPSDDAIIRSIPSSSSRDTPKSVSKRRDDDDRKGLPSLLKTKKRDSSSDRGRKSSTKLLANEKSIHVKSEDTDIEMTDAGSEVRASGGSDAVRTNSEIRVLQRARDDERKAAQAEIQVAEVSRKKEEEAKRLRQEEEGKRKREEDDRRKREDERCKREEESKRKEEEVRKKREEEERNERERKRVEDEERKRKEEERKRKEEVERKRREDEEKRKRAEEERLRQEQVAKEAAEEARRKREDDERKERERQERDRKERERVRAEREAEEVHRRQVEEEERVRISKLPALLQWLCQSTNCRSSTTAHKFRMMQGVRYDCINPSATGAAIGREQWLLNTQAALILGDKDLSLAKYPSWQHAPVSIIAKRIIWRLETDRYALTEPDLYDLGKQLPDYYEGSDPDTMSYQVVERLRGEAWEKFSATDMFFVKASDVMSIVPNFPHLRDVRLVMAYRELPEDEAQLSTFKVTQKWKNDPDGDRFYGFAPRNKYYINGQMVKEERPGFSAVSKTPFPEVRVPRRRGIVAVSVDDPDYRRLCKEQGIEPVAMASDAQSPVHTTGVALSPKSVAAKTNGKTAHSQDGLNGDTVDLMQTSPLSTAQKTPRQVNGINGTNGTNGTNGINGINGHS